MFLFERVPVRTQGNLRWEIICGAFVPFEHHIWAEEDYYLPESNVPRRINVLLNVTIDYCGSLTSPTQEIRSVYRFLPLEQLA